ncbi:hypothetical protein HDV00_001594 [Rhizophlyctis rosea]|nr:hypothetical protein HDV00_001594 [Rhizophlyctis rosea]
MQEVVRNIRRHIWSKEAEKRAERDAAIRSYKQLKKTYDSMTCSKTWTGKHKPKTCPRCKILKQAAGITINVYERPLPDHTDHANHVIFELCMPEALRKLRDALFLVRTLTNSIRQEDTPVFDVWSNHSELRSWRSGGPVLVGLGSTNKSFTVSHYRSRTAKQLPTDEDVIKPSALNIVGISLEKKKVFNLRAANVQQQCTVQAESVHYGKLQWMIDDTDHSENDVIATQNSCPLEIPLAEYLSFGYLRAGHRLQLRNICKVYMTQSLSLKEQAVVALIQQALWQCGPPGSRIGRKLLRDAHQDLGEGPFVETLTAALGETLMGCMDNWQEPNVLLGIIDVTLRLLSFAVDHDAPATLLAACRLVAWGWVEKIEGVIANAADSVSEGTRHLRQKLVEVAVCGALTFNVDTEDVGLVLGSPSSVSNWLKFTQIIHDNLLLNEARASHLPASLRHELRRVRRVGWALSPTLMETLKDRPSDLDDFVHRVCGNLGKLNIAQWAHLHGKQNQWFRAAYTMDDDDGGMIHINVWSGEFLVNGQPMGRLPEDIVKHGDFVRIFGSNVIDVRPSLYAQGAFTTIHSFRGLRYTFRKEGPKLIITARREVDSQDWTYLSYRHLIGDLPPQLTNNNSHWLKMRKGNGAEILEFYSVSFMDNDFLVIPTYQMPMTDRTLSEVSSGRIFVDYSSKSFQTIFRGGINRLEDELWVHVLRDPTTNGLVIELPRLGLQFEHERGKLWSREWPGWYVDDQQQYGTHIGLDKGLVIKLECEETISRKLLAPHGEVEVSSAKGHHESTIQLTSLHDPPCFIYDIDIPGGRLRAEESHEAWLYLALLHAHTSYFLPDPFTGLTGFEMAFKLLQSPTCRRQRPLSASGERILESIRRLSPDRRFYPMHLKKMQDVTWPKAITSIAAADGYTLLVDRIRETSEKLRFGNMSSAGRVDHGQRELSLKAHWRYIGLFGTEHYPITRNVSARVRGDGETLQSAMLIGDVCNSWTSGKFRDVSLAVFMMQGGKELVRMASLTDFDPRVTKRIDFRATWFEIYEAARNVSCNEDKCQVTILLSLVAFVRGKEVIKELLGLHAIAVNSASFDWPPPPNTTHWKELPACHYETRSIREALLCSSRQEMPLQSLCNKSPTETQQQFEVRRQREFTTLRDDEVSIITERLSATWPTDTCDTSAFTGALTISTAEARRKVKSLLATWYQNLELKTFLERVDYGVQNVPRRARALPESFPHSHRHVTSHQHPIGFEMPHPTRRPIRLTDALLLEATRYFGDGGRNVFASLFEATSVPQSHQSEDQPMPLHIRTNFSVGRHFHTTIKRSWEAYCGAATDTQSALANGDLLGMMTSQRGAFSNKAQEFWELAVDTFCPAEGDGLGKALMHAGLWFRPTRVTILPLLLDRNLPDEIRDLIGAAVVLWTCEQRAVRCINYLRSGRGGDVALKKELAYKIHENWSPKSHPDWLFFEFENNIAIRPIQVDVARKMIAGGSANGDADRNMVMQLNMGEGKTTVIIPLVVMALADGNKVVRLTVLKSLLEVNYESLVQKLGGLLGRSVYFLPCHRDMNIDISATSAMYIDCMKQRGVVITVPQHRLSFKLKGVEHCRRGEVELGRGLVGLQNWIDSNVWDVLDESDEILHVKYQLIYTVGSQVAVDGGEMRWKLTECVLKICAAHAEKLGQRFPGSIEFRKKGFHSYPHIAFLTDEPFGVLNELIVDELLSGKYKEVCFSTAISTQEEEIVRQFVLMPTADAALCTAVDRIFPAVSQSSVIVHLLRGLLAFGILRTALSKRWRVNYGVNPNGHRKSAVPFRAKDVAAERTEFGHPDMLIAVTVLSYYQSGLTALQLKDEVFSHLRNLENPDEEHANWLQDLPGIPESVRTLKHINFADDHQFENHLMPILWNNTQVIDFWLNTFVFPREAKLFEGKIGSNAWDLCAGTEHPTTGFSGTDDTSLLLPLTTRQENLSDLEGTNGKVIANLLNMGGQSAGTPVYCGLDQMISGRHIVQRMVDDPATPRVLLGVGALLLDLNNEGVAAQWLDLADVHDTDAAVFFDEGNHLTVVDRKGRRTRFELSPYKERLDRCVIYLDDVHTRGTDLKLPHGMRAVVTLGKGLTKDRLVQACMRMRMLANGHSVVFWASHEVDVAIRRHAQVGSIIGPKEVLECAFADGFDVDDEQVQAFGGAYTESESSNLERMYGGARQIETVPSILQARLLNMLEAPGQHTCHYGVTIINRCRVYVGNVETYAQLLGEEQERELEHEAEAERQIFRPGPADAIKPEVHPKLMYMITTGSIPPGDRNLLALWIALDYTTMSDDIQDDAWSRKLLVTADFRRVIRRQRNESLDQFLRPVSWILTLPHSSCYILISAFEANEALRIIYSVPAVESTLHMYARRTRRDQSMLHDEAGLILPIRPTPSFYFGPSDSTTPVIPPRLQAQVAAFSGSLYFGGRDEEDAYCDFLGFYPRPWDGVENYRETGVIGNDGYTDPERRAELGGEIALSRFWSNPSNVMMKLIHARNAGVPPGNAHATSILLKNRREFGLWRSHPIADVDAMDVDEGNGTEEVDDTGMLDRAADMMEVENMVGFSEDGWLNEVMDV